ncbi:hypothetical protein PR202_ga06933 [Eleusine coracana subsp. coracana]|uniref:Histone deacetylase domain-containing protein n=1 Tax=Eleusine coracana subsp. coracana TaxID=191504 RepID=A0AAV5BYH2_ELECO|nr:hypothetical protein PR202_ga06933 [Eleusine coracana subsp. coracana]
MRLAVSCRHPFDSSKWGRVCNFLVETGLLQKDRMVEPLEASEEDLLVDMCRVMIIDLDADQGNGHEKDFGSDERVYILDMYNSEIYPFDIDQKVELDNDTKTEDYLENLDKALKIVALHEAQQWPNIANQKNNSQHGGPRVLLSSLVPEILH